MLFATTSPFQYIGEVTTEIISDFWPWFTLIIGIGIAFFIIETLISFIPSKNSDDKGMYYVPEGKGSGIYLNRLKK